MLTGVSTATFRGGGGGGGGGGTVLPFDFVVRVEDVLRFGGGGGGGGGGVGKDFIMFRNDFCVREGTNWGFFSLKGYREDVLAIFVCFLPCIFSAEKRTSFRALMVGGKSL